MQNIIKNGVIRGDDSWVLLRADEEGQLPAVAADADVIVPFAAWLADKAAWQDRSGKLAVWLAPDAEPTEVAAALPFFDLVAIDFPAFTDGRGYSIARLLRERHGYSRELRAIGDVWKDHLHYMWQVGFDSFAIKDGKSAQDALDAYNTFTDRYHATFREPQPLFRRRSV